MTFDSSSGTSFEARFPRDVRHYARRGGAHQLRHPRGLTGTYVRVAAMMRRAAVAAAAGVARRASPTSATGVTIISVPTNSATSAWRAWTAANSTNGRIAGVTTARAWCATPSSGFAASATASAAASRSSAPPSAETLRKIFVFNAVPFVAFGFIDNTVLIYAGDAIDNSVGVAFGLSSLAAAAMGQIFSDTSGVLFGGAIEAWVLRAGFTQPVLTTEQNVMRVTRTTSTAGKVCGVVAGCCLGLLNLLLIDPHAAEKAKEEKEFTAVFRAIMDEGHNVVGCAAASLWIVDYDKRELWTRASSGNARDDAVVRRPFGCGIVGDVAATGKVSNVSNCSTHPAFDVSVDAEGVTGFTTHSALTGPVIDERGRVVAVVQLVNKGGGKDGEGARASRGGRGKEGRGGEGGGAKKTGWFGSARRGEKERRTFDENDERLLEMMCHHISVTFAAMEHKIPTG